MRSASVRFDSPLRAQHETYAAAETRRRALASTSRTEHSSPTHAAQVQWISWGNTAEVVSVFDSVELEYAAIRRSAAVCDRPERGTIEVTGADRIGFLQRMLTQDLRPLSAGKVARAWWLNRKGRIEADMLVCELGDRLLIDCAGSVAASTAAALGEFVFSDAVAIADISQREYRIAVHGPEALQLLSQIGACAQTLDCLTSPTTGSSCACANLAAIPCVLVRHDTLAEVGIDIIVPRDRAATVWSALLGEHDLLGSGRRRARPCGWHAFNIARIEAGTPLFEVDFSTSSLPHETGLVAQCVSFTKGCYLGQEIVARMASLGKPKQVVCAFRMDQPVLPIDGAQVFARTPDGSQGDEVGVVTSSTLSPMLGSAAIGFLTVKHAYASPGSEVLIVADGASAPAHVQSGLAWVKPSTEARGRAT